MAQQWECLPPTSVAGFKSWHQCHTWVEFVVGSLLCSERFFCGYSGFPLSSKPTFPNFHSTRNQVDEEPLCGCATSKSLIIYLCMYLEVKSRAMLQQHRVIPLGDYYTVRQSLALSTHIWVFLKVESIFCFEKNSCPHICVAYPNHFLPIHTKRVKQWKLIGPTRGHDCVL